MVYEYLKDPAEIYRRSFAAIEKEADFSSLPLSLHRVARRMVHACAMPEIVNNIAWNGDPIDAAKQALERGAPIIADARMVLSGLITRYFEKCSLHCILDDKQLAGIAAREQTTLSSSGMGMWRDRWENAIILIGNAPTALFRLLEELEEGAAKPAVIFAFPIGFIGAAESKDALMQAKIDIPFLTLRGKFGGSALAAAAINALRETQ